MMKVIRGFEYTDPKNRKVSFEVFSQRCGIEFKRISKAICGLEKTWNNKLRSNLPSWF